MQEIPLQNGEITSQIRCLSAKKKGNSRHPFRLTFWQQDASKHARPARGGKEKIERCYEHSGQKKPADLAVAGESNSRRVGGDR